MTDTNATTNRPDRRHSPSEGPAVKPPFHPYLVLAVAVLLPGVGQLFNNTATRGLMMAFSMLTLGWVSYHLTTPEHSFLGRYAGGFFIYAISILDAYRWARYRWEIFHKRGGGAPAQ